MVVIQYFIVVIYEWFINFTLGHVPVLFCQNYITEDLLICIVPN